MRSRGSRTFSPHALAPDGTLVSRSYTLIEQIGRGAAGTVWRARANATGREYAIKILHDDPAGAPKAVARFLQERAILLRLRHEHLVAVHDLLTTADGRLALVLDLVTGGTLRELLDQRVTMPPAEAATLLAQVAAGLAAAHAAGIVHRDLKPDNILLAMRPDGGTRVRLTDFGIARVTDGPRLTTTGAVLGTPNYMAPEVIEGAHATPASDVYALGIILYELLAGRPPFDDACDTAILLHHTRARARPVTGMPPGVWAVIESCLARDARSRPSAAGLSTTLLVLAEETAGAGALAQPDFTTYVVPGRVPAPRRARRAWTSAVAVLVTLMLAGGGYLATRLGDPPGQHDRSAAAPSVAGPPGTPPPRPSGTVQAFGPAPERPDTQPPATSPMPRAAEQAGSPVGSAGPEDYGWECGSSYRWALGHPVLGKACHAIGERTVRVIGTLKAAPGVQTDLTLVVRNADTDAEVAGPFDCVGLTFTDVVSEHSCGPFAVDLERGHRYRIVARWKYTGAAILPGGSVAGDPFDW